MPVPSSMADLSAVAGANSPGNNENAAGVVDDYFQALSAILRGTESYRTGVASASTINVTAYPEKYIQVTGTATISSLGTGSPGQVRVLRFTDAATLVHSAVLVLPLSANIKTAPSDVVEFVYLENAWVCTDYQTFTGAEGCALAWTGATATTPSTAAIITNPASGLLLGGSGTVSVARNVNGAWSNGTYTAIRSGMHAYNLSIQAGTGGVSTGYIVVYPFISDALQTYYQTAVPASGWQHPIGHQIYLSSGQTLKFRAFGTDSPLPAVAVGSIVITYVGA